MTILKVLWPYLVAMLGGLVLAFAFPPFNQAEWVWVMPVLLLGALWLGGQQRWQKQRRVGKRFGFVVGWLGGLVFWCLNLKWLAVVTGPGYLILAAYLAIFAGVFGSFAATVGNPLLREKVSGARDSPWEEALRSLGFAAVSACLWCGLEWIRGWLFTGFGWNGLGVAFYDRLVLAQGAELVGVYGLSFLPVFVGGVLVQVGVRFVRGLRAGRMERHWDFAGAMVVLAGCFFYGVLRTAAVNRAPAETLKVLLVQLDIPQVASARAWSEDKIYAEYQAETLRALREVERENTRLMEEAEGAVELERIDWVVWPETVLTNSLLTATTGESGFEDKSGQLINELQEAGVRTFVTGAQEFEFEAEVDEDGTISPTSKFIESYNSMVAVTSDRTISVYRKQHLVIYGEFIPFEEEIPLLVKIYEMAAGVPWGGNMGRGGAVSGFTLPGAGGEVAVIPSICFEDTVPRVTRKFSEQSRELIVNVTNDGWFGTTEGSRQHYANAVFRSIELRRPMIRAANRGVTGIVSATGSLVDYDSGERQVLENEEGKPFVAGHVRGDVRISKHRGTTLYARFGDWFCASGFVVALVFGGICFWRSKVRRKPGGRKAL
jgi:apolipoprotein N-acyltransferase